MNDHRYIKVSDFVFEPFTLAGPISVSELRDIVQGWPVQCLDLSLKGIGHVRLWLRHDAILRPQLPTLNASLTLLTGRPITGTGVFAADDEAAHDKLLSRLRAVLERAFSMTIKGTLEATLSKMLEPSSGPFDSLNESRHPVQILPLVNSRQGFQVLENRKAGQNALLIKNGHNALASRPLRRGAIGV